MALSDKNIVITPNIGAAANPKIVFAGADATTAAQNITLTVYPTNSGTLSFDGSTGQLFSITNSMTGTIYSVNDISGIPSIEVLDTGLIKLAQYSGNIVLGSATDTGLAKLQVTGSLSVTGNTIYSTNSRSIYGPNTTWSSYLYIGGDSINGITRTGSLASVVTSNGNLHLDSGSDKAMYLNHYSGTGGIQFGNGASGTTATMSAAGVLSAANVLIGGNQVLHAGNYNSYAPTLTGTGASGTWAINVSGTSASISGFNNPTSAATANTIVYRDPNGNIYGQYIYGTYLNASAGNSENPSIGQIWTQSTTDTFLRKSTPAHFISQLGLLTTSGDAAITSGKKIFYSPNNTFISSVASDDKTLAVFQQTAGADAYMSFHISGDYAAYFGLGGAENDLVYGGWSAGATRHRILHGGNYNSYTPTLTGTGASGTWAINVTGNAATLSRFLVSNTVNNGIAVAENYIGYISDYSGTALTASVADGALYSQVYSASWQHEIYGDYRSGQIALRGKNNGTWQAWRTVLDSTNYTSYTISPSVSTNFTAPQRPALGTETAPTTNALTWDLTTTSIVRINLNANITTLTLTGTLSTYAGYQYQAIVRYNGGTAITWPATIKFSGGTTPTLTGTSGKVDIFNFVVASNDGGTTFFMLCTGSSQNL